MTEKFKWQWHNRLRILELIEESMALTDQSSDCEVTPEVDYLADLVVFLNDQLPKDARFRILEKTTPGSEAEVEYRPTSDRGFVRSIAQALGWTLLRADIHVDDFVRKPGDEETGMYVSCMYDGLKPYDRFCEGSVLSNVGRHTLWTDMARTMQVLRGYDILKVGD